MAVQFIVITFTETDFAANLFSMYSACTALNVIIYEDSSYIFFSAFWCQKYKSSINGTVCHGKCIQVKYERSLYDWCKHKIMQCMNSEYTWEFWLRNLLFWTIQPICFILSTAERPYLWVWQQKMFSQAAFCFPYLIKVL